MKTKNYKKRLEEWRSKQEREEVDLSKIDIVYKIHKKAQYITLNEKLDKKRVDEKFKTVVMKKSNGRYTLLFGISDLVVLKLLNYEKANLIVTNLNRNEVEKEFMED